MKKDVDRALNKRYWINIGIAPFDRKKINGNEPSAIMMKNVQCIRTKLCEEKAQIKDKRILCETELTTKTHQKRQIKLKYHERIDANRRITKYINILLIFCFYFQINKIKVKLSILLLFLYNFSVWLYRFKELLKKKF